MTYRRHDAARLSAAEALQGLYVDFEGRRDEPPVLLGIHRRGRGDRPHVQQDVLEPAFAAIASGCRHRTLRDAVENVVRRAEHGDRRLVSWSEHDLDVVRALRDEDPELVARFEARHANARAFAEYWRNRLHGGDRPETGRLADYLALIGYAVPAEAEPGHVGDTIRDLRPRLARGLAPTAGQAARWERLLEHNRFDCAGMRAVCLRAARELAAASASGPASAAVPAEMAWRGCSIGA
jgi:hypothetical protein